jgi:hypothetical protein
VTEGIKNPNAILKHLEGRKEIVMPTFFIQPENFDALPERWQAHLTEKINEAIQQ